MADLPHFNKLFHFPSPFLKSHLSFPLNLSPLHNFSPFRRGLSLFSLNPNLSSPSNSPNSFLISTSVNSDGSLLFKFGDESEISPSVENADCCDTTSVDAEIEVESKAESDDNLAYSVSQIENDVEDDVQVNDSPKEVLEFKEIAKVEQNQDDLVVVSEIEDSSGAQPVEDNDAVTITNDDSSFDESKLVFITENNFDVENLDSEEALENEEVDDKASSMVGMVKHDDDDVVEMMELPPVQLEAEPIPAEEVNDAGLPSIAGLEDSRSGDSADVAFPSLVESMGTLTETIIDRALPREEISSQSGDISTLSFSLSSASVPLSHPFKVNDAVPSAILQSVDNTESRDISEPAGPGPNSSSTVSAEANLDSVQISTVALSVTSPTASLLQAIEVNDASIPSIEQDDDVSDIYVAADPGPGISATTDISLREEISAPSLCLVSAAASLAHSAEALAGVDDAYFVCENCFGVADGVGQWSFGGIDKGLFAQEFIHNCESLARKSLNTGLNSFKELFQQSAAMTESSGAARVLIAHIADQVLHVANIGDAGFIIIRNGTVFMKSSPMFHEFNFPCAITSGDNPVEAAEEYHVELKDGDIIVAATDGLFDNLYEHEIASFVCKAVEDGMNMKDIAELLASRSQEVGRSPFVRTPFADAALAAGHPEFSGGKFDHVTVIVSAVQKE